jgi:O-antigen/teichoic acid export membrane protein
MFKVFFSYFILKGVNVLISLLGVFILTRVMSPYEYGIYSYGLTFLIVISSILFEWITSAIARYFPSNPDKILKTSMSAFIRETLGLLLAGFLMYLFIINIRPSLFEDYGYFYIFFAVVSFSMLGFFSICAQLLNSSEKIILYNVLHAFRHSFSVIAALVMIHFGVNENYYYLSFSVGSFIAVCFIIGGSYHKLKTKNINLRLTKVESYLYSYGVPVSILFASILIVDFSDRVLISYFLSFEELAVYSASYDLIQRTFGAILGVAYIAYFPRIAAFWEKNDKAKVELMLSNLFIIIIILGTYIGIFVSLFYEYFSLLIGQEIRNTPKFLAILISIGILFGALKFYVLDMDYKLKSNILKLIKISLVMIVLNLILNYITIPLLGITGAAASTAITFFLGSLFVYFLSSQIIPKNMFISFLSKVAISLISALIISYVFGYFFNINDIYESIILLVIFTLLLFVLKINKYYVSM